MTDGLGWGRRFAGLWLAGVVGAGMMAGAQETVPRVLTEERPGVAYGPYNGRFLEGGIGLTKPLQAHEALAVATVNWTLSLWLKTDDAGTTAVVAGLGRLGDGSVRMLALEEGRPAFRTVPAWTCRRIRRTVCSSRP